MKIPSRLFGLDVGSRSIVQILEIASISWVTVEDSGNLTYLPNSLVPQDSFDFIRASSLSFNYNGMVEY